MIKVNLVRQEEQVELTSSDGKVEIIILREISGSDRDAYLAMCYTKVRMDPEGKPIGMDQTGVRAELLHISLWRGDEKVPRDEINGWPAGAVEPLFDAAQSISALNQTGIADAGND